MTDPSWFYSSLAQSAASIVGLGGALTIFQVQSNVADWVAATRDLPRLQYRWAEARLRVEGERATFGEPRIIGKKYEDGVAIGSAQELRERWNDLRFQVELRDNAQFPKVLIWLVTVVAALLISGCVLPLIALGEPSNAQQLLALSPFTALSLTIGAIGFRRAQKAFQTWKAVEVWQRVRDELEDERLHEEAWEEQDTREREERERAAADDAD